MTLSIAAIRERVANRRPRRRIEDMTDRQLLGVLVKAGLSRTSAAAAVDVCRQVQEAIEEGTITPRAGWR